MDWPQAEESKLFALADALADAAYRVADGTGVSTPDREAWDGAALEAFVEHTSRKVGSRQAEVLARLVTMAMALNDLGVQVQYTKRMIKLSIVFLTSQLITLLPVIMNPATSGPGLAAAGLRARFTKAIVTELAKRLLFNIALFGGLMGGMDLYVQATQTRRDRIDWNQVLASIGSGALNGVFLTGAIWLRPPRTLLDFMITSGVAGGLTDATMQAFDDQPFDLERLLKGLFGGAVSAADARWAGGNPHFGRSDGDGAAPPRARGGDGPLPSDPFGGPRRDGPPLSDPFGGPRRDGPPPSDPFGGPRRDDSTTLAGYVPESHGARPHPENQTLPTGQDGMRTGEEGTRLAQGTEAGDRIPPRLPDADLVGTRSRHGGPGIVPDAPGTGHVGNRGRDLIAGPARDLRPEPLAVRGSEPSLIESKLNWGQERPAAGPPRPPHVFGPVAAEGPVGAWEPAGLDSVRVTLTDGSHAMLTDLPTSQARDAKVLVAQLGQELGLKMPSVHPVGDARLLVDWVYGDPGRMSWSGEAWNLPGTVATRDGVLAGLLGALLRDEPVLLDALSGEAALMPEPATAKLMSRLFIRDLGAGQEVWAPNPLSPMDAARIQHFLKVMRLDFADAGLADAHRRMTATLQKIMENVVSTDSILKADPTQALPEITVQRLNSRGEQIADVAADLMDTTPTGVGRPLMDPAQRLADNLDEIVASRESDLGRVVTFGDGSQALALTGRAAAEALEAALTRRALGLDGPAVHQAADGTVYQTYGSEHLRATLATGIRDSDLMPLAGNRSEVVTFNDGTRAIRHEFDSIGKADEFEAQAHAAHGIRDGVQGTYRAAPTVVYEHRIGPWHWTDKERAVPATLRPELDRRALHAWLTHADLSTAPARENPRLEHLVPGEGLLTEADSAVLRSRYEGLRPEFERYGLATRYQEHLKLISHVDPHAALDLGPLHDRSPLVPDFRETSWRPPGNQVPALPHLLEGSNLRQVNELAVGRAADPALIPMAETQLDRADAELAGRLTAAGHVSVRVPVNWLPGDVRPRSEIVFRGMLEGVEDPTHLGDLPDSVRLTIRASRYANVEDLSGKPAHALFGAGVRLKVLAVQESLGERHLLAVQVPDGRKADSIALRVPRMKPPLTSELRHHLKEHVEKTPAGVWLRDLDNEHDRVLTTSARKARPIDGAFYVDGHGSERGNAIGDQTLDARLTAALLLHSPGLSPHDVILLANCRIGAGRHPAAVARLTGHVVIAADSAIEVTEGGHMRAVSSELGHLGGRGRLRIYFPDDPVSGQVVKTVAAWFQAP
ncbi:WXG100-like domain-containing protein [Streptosporangium sp. NBC_01756]|uniref:WXG100-like domain-containing protein n=1 Tax=Streptosporangium sp. NBC_01756 TaxID=2975950 RepID=UPI002DD80BD5|nr:hypothetical protein [Streptosporangium sp. NBC_01756]WSC83260.1 hypothetical protein OIE48_22885 [Streptosporangium sp. NBC_01756]